MSGKVLILGNGFDLDLGMKTRYSDFANSDIWEQSFQDDMQLYRPDTLLGYLNKEKEKNAWFDIEQSMLNYVTNKKNEYGIPDNDINDDKKSFRKLCHALSMYLKHVQTYYSQRKNNVAVEVLKAVAANGYFRSIYTFNYTNLRQIASDNGITLGEANIMHVHGSLAADDIILGVMADNASVVPEEYSFLYKDNSRYYQSNNMATDLDEANELVIFGHSINGMDFDYFRDFFLKQPGEKGDFKKKRITIFTYDENSDSQIRNSIRKIGINPRQLFNRNELCFIHTKLLSDGDNLERNRYNDFIKHLNEHSEEAHLRTLSSIL